MGVINIMYNPFKFYVIYQFAIIPCGIKLVLVEPGGCVRKI